MYNVKYIGHSWGCHPETCACREWAVVKGDAVIQKCFDQDEARRLVKILNKESK